MLPPAWYRRGIPRRAIEWGLALLVVLAVAGRAGAQPCVTCRTEKCPRKASLVEWCGAGKDPLAKKKPPKAPRGDGGGGKTFVVRVESTPGKAVVVVQQAGKPDVA